MDQAPANLLLIRKATLDDWEILLEWRSDPITRSASRNPNPIDEQSHLKWFSESLTNIHRQLLIAVLNSEPVGTVRIDLADRCEVSWTVAPSARGKGLGAKMVELALRDIAQPLVAVVKSTNRASLRIAEAAGFAPVEREEEWITLHRPANFGKHAHE